MAPGRPIPRVSTIAAMNTYVDLGAVWVGFILGHCLGFVLQEDDSDISMLGSALWNNTCKEWNEMGLRREKN